MAKELTTEEQDRIKQQIDIVAGKEVTLGTQTYRVRELGAGAAKAWRAKFGEKIMAVPYQVKILSALTQTQLMHNETIEVPRKDNAEAAPIRVNMVSAVVDAMRMAVNHLDDMEQMIKEYCQHSNTDRPIDWEDYNVYGLSSQLYPAFVEVFHLAYPLPFDLKGLQSLIPGLQVQQTGKN